MDASKIYDRVYTNMSSITVKLLGLQKNISRTFYKTLIKTQHLIKKIYGLSKLNIQQKSNNISSGLGQEMNTQDHHGYLYHH